MKTFIFFLILIFITSCSSNKSVYWCGDHACSNNKEKENYFKKTMIVEVRNLDKEKNNDVSVNEKIINQSKTEKNKLANTEKKIDQEINLEEKLVTIDEDEIQEQIEIQEQMKKQAEERAKEEKDLKEQIKLEERSEIKKKHEKTSSTFAKIVEIEESSSKNFDEIVEKILIRNSTRSYPKINDIPK
tara:strand:- start:37 stop:597 length:561 start_codon:yes stop_codon:yes gene_type:complete